MYYEFPGTEYTLGPTLPVTWYDAAGVLPPRENLGDIPASYKLPGAGSVLVGEKGSLVIPHVAMPKIFPEEKFATKELPVIEGVDHYTQWADACRGSRRNHFAFRLRRTTDRDCLARDDRHSFSWTRTRLGRQGSQDHKQRKGSELGYEALSKRLGTNLGVGWRYCRREVVQDLQLTFLSSPTTKAHRMIIDALLPRITP